MSHYIGIFDQAEDGSFGVTFPDLPGCTSSGATLDEAYRNAIGAVRDWVEVRYDRGINPPSARDVGALLGDPERNNGIMVAVPCIARYGRTVRVQLTMDEGTLAAIDDAARLTSETRSGFVARVASEAAAKLP